MAGAVMLEVLPVLLLAPLAGLAADRLPRRRLMVAADLARAACASVLVVVTDSVAVAYAVAFGLSTGAVVFKPAAGSLLPEVVGDDDVVTANSALWSTAVVAQIALAPTAGVILAAHGVEVAFAINAATFLASAVLLSDSHSRSERRLPRRPRTKRGAPGSSPADPDLLDLDLDDVVACSPRALLDELEQG